MAAVDDFEKVTRNESYSAAFREAIVKGKLNISHCLGCSACYLPPRPICPKCHHSDMTINAVKGRGKLVAYTVIKAVPPLMMAAGYGRDNPYCCGIVLLNEGVKVTARILGLDVHHPDEIKIGTPLTLEFQEIGRSGEKHTCITFRMVK